MVRRPIFWVVACLLLAVAVAAGLLYARSGKLVRIEITGTEGLFFKGTVTADGSQLQFSGPVFAQTNPPNQIRAASARHLEFTIEKRDGTAGELIVDVFRDDEPVLHARAGDGLRWIRGQVGSGAVGIVAE